MGDVKVGGKKGNTQATFRNFEFWIVILTIAYLLAPFTAAACPMCKESLFDPGQIGQKIATAKGYAISIGMLLAVPFILVASVIALVARSTRRAHPVLPANADGVDTSHKTR